MYRDLRLEGLTRNPEAFSSSVKDEAEKPLSWFENRLENSLVFGAHSEEGTLDAVAGLLFPEGTNISHKAKLTGVYLRPEIRGTGLARLLVKYVIEQAKNIVEQVLLTVVASNAPAVNLYKGIGFEEYGLEKNALKINGEYHDEVLMIMIFDQSHHDR